MLRPLPHLSTSLVAESIIAVGATKLHHYYTLLSTLKTDNFKTLHALSVVHLLHFTIKLQARCYCGSRLDTSTARRSGHIICLDLGLEMSIIAEAMKSQLCQLRRQSNSPKVFKIQICLTNVQAE